MLKIINQYYHLLKDFHLSCDIFDQYISSLQKRNSKDDHTASMIAAVLIGSKHNKGNSVSLEDMKNYANIDDITVKIQDILSTLGSDILSTSCSDYINIYKNIYPSSVITKALKYSIMMPFLTIPRNVKNEAHASIVLACLDQEEKLLDPSMYNDETSIIIDSLLEIPGNFLSLDTFLKEEISLDIIGHLENIMTRSIQV